MLTEAEKKASLLSRITEVTIKSKVTSWIRNLVQNEENIRSGRKLDSLRGRLRNVPCIIVGSGPSLSKNKHLLKGAKDKAFILCTDTALEAIKDIVLPDAIIALESRPELADLIDFDITEKIPLFADLTVTPKVIEKWKGEVIWLTAGFCGIESLNEVLEKDFNDGKPIGRVLPGGCVTNSGFSVAKDILKCDPIILMGADCSFADPRKQHDDGVNSTIPCSDDPLRVDEDIFGNNIYTTDVYMAYKTWMEGIVRQRNPDTNRWETEGIYINATEGGTIKNGWLIMSLKTVITSYLPKKYNLGDFTNLNKKIVGKNSTVTINRTVTFGKNGVQEVTKIEDNKNGTSKPEG